jgi:uncharacterized protein
VKWSPLRERRRPKPAGGGGVPSDLNAVMPRHRLGLTRGPAYTTFVLVTPFFSAPAMPLSPAELDRLRPVLERIVAALSPEEIWLFGSRAENRARPKSDYDLLAILPDGTPEAELDPVRAWSLVRGLGVPVDIMPCTRSEFEEEKHEIDTLARAAFLRGIRLYERAA